MPEEQSPKYFLKSLVSTNYVLLVEYRYEPAEFWTALEFDTKVNLEILRRFEEAGISIAYPTETQIIKTDESGPRPAFEIISSEMAKED